MKGSSMAKQRNDVALAYINTQIADLERAKNLIIAANVAADSNARAAETPKRTYTRKAKAPANGNV